MAAGREAFDNMAASLGYVLCAVVLGSFVGGAWSLDCYQCNSHNDSRCLKTPLPDSMKLPCIAGRDKMCRKITQTIEFEMNGLTPDKRIIRSCGWDESSYVQKCYSRAGSGGRQEVCSCIGELCNSAGIPAVMTTLLFAALLFVRFW